MSTQKISSFIISTSFDSLPSEVIAKAKALILDHIGVMLAARGDKAVAAASKMAVAMGGCEEATLIDTGIKVPCNLAAMVNAIMTGTLDMDDGAYRPTGHIAHGGRVVIPSSIAVAERQNATGKCLMEAAVIGYEVALRAGWIISMWGTYPISGMTGTYGAAAAAARLFRLGAEETANALGIAEAHCLHMSRVKKMAQVVMTKDAEGWGAMTGVTAALLAQAGFEGPETIFDLPEYSKEPMERLGLEWDILRVYHKLYGGTRSIHASIDGIFGLMKKHQIGANDISKVKVGVANYAMVMTNYRPNSIWNAQYSIPFVIGAAIADGEVGPKQLVGNRLADKSILSQVDKVEVVHDSEAEKLRPGTCPARVKIETHDGRAFETFVPYPKGGPENPISKEELRNKYFSLASGMLGTDKAADLYKCIDRLEEMTNVSQLLEILNSNKDG